MKKFCIYLAFGLCVTGAYAAGGHDTIADIYFRFDKSDITPVASVVLENVAARVEHPKCVSVRVVGHTCALGKKGYNDRLGLKRAKSVKAALVRMGFNPDNIQVETVGSREPIAKYDRAGSRTEKNHIRNRVAEIYLLPRTTSWWQEFNCKRGL
ncbi:MAG: OmpA family protein [Rickettsiales bacterium]|jgi:outer membrane protein OmpA-like peptidoglycan-associated protein|nr:OmpA family protein [Rickettsiales bacterium]